MKFIQSASLARSDRDEMGVRCATGTTSHKLWADMDGHYAAHNNHIPYQLAFAGNISCINMYLIIIISPSTPPPSETARKLVSIGSRGNSQGCRYYESGGFLINLRPVTKKRGEDTRVGRVGFDCTWSCWVQDNIYCISL